MRLLITFTILMLAGILCGSARNISPTNEINLTEYSITVPLGGNTYARNGSLRDGTVKNNGIINWSNINTQFDTYIRINQPGIIKIKLQAKTDGVSTLKFSIGKEDKVTYIKGDQYEFFDAGEWSIKDTGYVKITLSGILKTGNLFADISNYEISGTAINSQTAFVKNNEGNFFYWGRRGPSVHLSYPFTDSLKAEWFYNEITVPQGEDVVGSYYMANGFGEGYFGIQVNSNVERRILFSVWSPFATDDPKSIPEDMRITMLKKGKDVHTGEFGNEGSGGQSYLKYNWKAGNTYKFLLNGHPDGKGNTIYTSYFFAPEKNEWLLIASFKRPKTNTYLKRFHSFLENFSPDQGDKERHVLFGNQWIRDTDGEWTQLNRAVFTYDNTAASGYRMDYAGGLSDGKFYLKNCGFFDHYTPYRKSFTRPELNTVPTVDLTQLP